MGVDLEAEQPGEVDSLLGGLDLTVCGFEAVGCGPAVLRQHLGVDALYPHLDLGAPQLPDDVQACGVHGIGACFHHQADHTMPGMLVARVLFEQGSHVGGLPAFGLLPGVRLPVEPVGRLVVGQLPAIDHVLEPACVFRQPVGVVFDAGIMIELAPGLCFGIALPFVVQGFE